MWSAVALAAGLRAPHQGGKQLDTSDLFDCIVRHRHFIFLKVREDVVLGPGELVFLLEDMLFKLEFSLTAATARRAPFLKVLGTKQIPVYCIYRVIKMKYSNNRQRF